MEAVQGMDNDGQTRRQRVCMGKSMKVCVCLFAPYAPVSHPLNFLLLITGGVITNINHLTSSAYFASPAATPLAQHLSYSFDIQKQM